MLFVGCPIWNSKEWPGDFLPRGTSATDALAAYARRLPMVEGNTTFYATPAVDVIARWRDQTPEGFRFCLKFPRSITHDRMLVGAERETAEWLDRLLLLDDRRGPSFLQLPRDFGPDRFDSLRDYLGMLPTDLTFSLEPRHPGWFAKEVEPDLNALLSEYGIGRVLYDVRPLRAADRSDAGIRKAQDSKPQVPVRVARTASHAHLRYIAHPDLAMNDRPLAQWTPIAARWIEEGATVYVAMHSIVESHMPHLCRTFHDMVGAIVPLPPLPDWADIDEPSAQMSLF
jgi:uncharacterized protein YecE (DUF72 family)